MEETTNANSNWKKQKLIPMGITTLQYLQKNNNKKLWNVPITQELCTCYRHDLCIKQEGILATPAASRLETSWQETSTGNKEWSADESFVHQREGRCLQIRINLCLRCTTISHRVFCLHTPSSQSLVQDILHPRMCSCGEWCENTIYWRGKQESVAR